MGVAWGFLGEGASSIPLPRSEWANRCPVGYGDAVGLRRRRLVVVDRTFGTSSPRSFAILERLRPRTVILLEHLPRHGFRPSRYNKTMTTTHKYLALDIETGKIIDSASDWRSFRPLGISCAATLLSGDNEPSLWHGGDRANPNDRMSREEAAALVHYLEDRTKEGYTLAHLERAWLRLRHPGGGVSNALPVPPLALDHVDMMFHVFCQLGFGVGLDAAARGMGLAGKLEGIKGADAPVLWAEGRREEVLRYVAQDVRTTLDLARICERCGALRWVARSGKVRTMPLPEGWLSVGTALELPLPDTSWMSDPWPRTKFTGWMR